MSLLSEFDLCNDSLVFGNNFSEAQCTSYIDHNWNDNMLQRSEGWQQVPRCVQQTSQNFDSQPSLQVPDPDYEALLEELATICDEELPNQCISQTDFQSGNHQDLFQNRYIPHPNLTYNGNCYNPSRSHYNLSCDLSDNQNVPNQMYFYNENCIDHSRSRSNRLQTNCLNTNTGLKGVTKRKRKRTMFTTEQVTVLEHVFLTKPYINRDERQALVNDLKIEDKVIKVWFQNRRFKQKKVAEESKKEFYCQNQEDKQQKEHNKGPIYEPISQASSICSNSETATKFEPFEPMESLQRLFDVHEFLRFNKTI